MAAAPKTRASDMTGRKREQLQKEHAEEIARRAEEMSVAAAVQAEAEANSVTDLTQGAPVIIDSVEEVEEVEASLSETSVVIRVNEDIDDMTLGVGNIYSFKMGQKYKVPKAVADHLEEKGYVWH